MLLIISVHIFDCTFIKFNGAFSSFYIHRFLFCIVFIPYFFLFSAHIFDWGAQKANPAWTFNKVNSVSSAKVKHISSVELSTFCLSCGYFGEISLFSFPACWLCWPFLIWEWGGTMQYILWLNVSLASFFSNNKNKIFLSPGDSIGRQCFSMLSWWCLHISNIDIEGNESRCCSPHDCWFSVLYLLKYSCVKASLIVTSIVTIWIIRARISIDFKVAVIAMAFRVVRLRREARRNAKLDEIFQVSKNPIFGKSRQQWF